MRHFHIKTPVVVLKLHVLCLRRFAPLPTEGLLYALLYPLRLCLVSLSGSIVLVPGVGFGSPRSTPRPRSNRGNPWLGFPTRQRQSGQPPVCTGMSSPEIGSVGCALLSGPDTVIDKRTIPMNSTDLLRMLEIIRFGSSSLRQLASRILNEKELLNSFSSSQFEEY